MSRIRNVLKFDSRAESSVLKTTDRLSIVNNRVVLTDNIIGNVVWNKVMIFEDLNSSVISKYATCTTENNIVLFDPNDNLDGKYCVFSYLAIKVV